MGMDKETFEANALLYLHRLIDEAVESLDDPMERIAWLIPAVAIVHDGLSEFALRNYLGRCEVDLEDENQFGLTNMIVSILTRNDALHVSDHYFETLVTPDRFVSAEDDPQVRGDVDAILEDKKRFALQLQMALEEK